MWFSLTCSRRKWQPQIRYWIRMWSIMSTWKEYGCPTTLEGPTISRMAVDAAREMPLRDSDVILGFLSQDRYSKTWLYDPHLVLHHRVNSFRSSFYSNHADQKSDLPPPPFLTHPLFNNTYIYGHSAIFSRFRRFRNHSVLCHFCPFFSLLFWGGGTRLDFYKGGVGADSRVEFLRPHEVIPVLRCTRPTTNRSMSQDTLIS